MDALRTTIDRGHRILNIATWNVRSMLGYGKLQQVQHEADRLSIDILGLAEIRWTKSGKQETNGWHLYYKGDESEHQRGVGFLVSPKIARSVLRIQPVNDRIFLLRVNAKPQPITLIQIYMPTTDASDDDVLEVYAEVQKLVDECPRKDRLIVMGDFNARLGSNTSHTACGKFGYGAGNERGQLLMDWLGDNDLIALNTCFQHREKQRYTWVTPDGLTKTQIDYIACRRRDLKECSDSRALVSADCGTDHQMVWARIKGRAWRRKQHRTQKLQPQLGCLKIQAVAYAFERDVSEYIRDKEITWGVLQSAIQEATEIHCPSTPKADKPWLNENPEILEMIEERRSLKLTDFQGMDYRNQCKKVKKACRRAKRRWLSQLCKEADKAYKVGDTRQVYDLIRKISKKRSASVGLGIKDEEGEMVYDTNGILERWYRYARGLYQSCERRSPNNPNSQRSTSIEEVEPPVLLDEIRIATRKLKNNKAPGMDGIWGETLKAGGETVIKAVKKIIDHVWTTGDWPGDWSLSEMIPLPKTSGTQECTNFRTISLISHAAKILLEVIRNRLAYFINPEIAEVQFGFMPGKGTSDAILALRNIIEKTVKKQNQQLWIMFVDYRKAFDSVEHSKMWQALRDLGAPVHLIWLIEKLYNEAEGTVRLNNEHTQQFPLGRGVRQGCPLSPLLFNACGEIIMRRVQQELGERTGCTIGGQAFWNLRYADDIALLASSKEELERQADALLRHSAVFGLEINKLKTLSMSIGVDQADRPQLDGQRVEQVTKFKYLGSMITNDGDIGDEVRIRLAIARRVTLQLVEVWRSKEIGIRLKKQLVTALVWSIATYATESWTLKKSTEKRISAFEMWVWRRVLRCSWRDKKTNEWVRKQIGVREEDGLLAEIKRRKLSKYAHWKRRPESAVLTTIEGEVEGRAKRGRRRTGWVDNVREWTGGMTTARRMALERRMPTAR